MDCCGWNGRIDFKDNNDPIDESCYQTDARQSNSGVLGGGDLGLPTPRPPMIDEGCGPKLFDWFADNKITWVTVLACAAALQVMCVGIAVYIVKRVHKMKKLK